MEQNNTKKYRELKDLLSNDPLNWDYFLELDRDALLGDGPKIVIAVVRDVVLEFLEDRYAEDVGNTLLVEPIFNLAVHALPICGSGTGVAMTVEIRINLVNVR